MNCKGNCKVQLNLINKTQKYLFKYSKKILIDKEKINE